MAAPGIPSAWRSEPRSVAGFSLAKAVLIQSPNGGWALSTDPGATAEATLVISPNGGAAADDTLSGSGVLRRSATRTIGIL